MSGVRESQGARSSVIILATWTMSATLILSLVEIIDGHE
jgi:hypothetical protein